MCLKKIAYEWYIDIDIATTKKNWPRGQFLEKCAKVYKGIQKFAKEPRGSIHGLGLNLD